MDYLNTIKKKILATNGLMLVILLTVLVYALSALRSNQQLLIEQEQAKTELEMIAGIKETFFELKMANDEFILLLKNSNRSRRDGMYQKTLDGINQINNTTIKVLESDLERYYQQIKHAAAVFIDDDRMLGNFDLTEANQTATTILSVLNEQYSNQKQLELSIFESVSESNDNVSSALYILFGVMLLVGISVSIFLASIISSEISGLTETIKHIEKHGDLTIRASIDANDEVGVLAKTFNKLIDNLFAIVSEVQVKGDQLVSSAATMSEVANTTRQGVQSQSQEISQVATAMTQMSATVGEVANITHQASALADTCNQESASGSQVVNETIEVINELEGEVQKSATAIDELKSHSENIGTVLDVIKNISEQTNLLALNAAIEAARAGEQGRGFAVVADEVRTLAQRTQASTGEIENLVDSLQKGSQLAFDMMSKSRQKASDTVLKAQEAGKSLDTITQSVSNIADLNTQIAGASEQQSTTTEEVTRNMTNIQAVSEETSEGVRHTSENSKTLNEVGLQLQALVGQFKIR